MNLKKRTYRLFLTSSLLLLNFLTQGGVRWYSELPDSIRTSIRLRTHLLIHPDAFTTEELNSLAGQNVPLAFYEEDIPGAGQSGWFRKFAGRQNHIPVLARPVQGDAASLPTGAVRVRMDELDRVRLFPVPHDSLYADSLFTSRELLYADPGDTETPDCGLFVKLWSQTGKVPNLIPASPSNMQEIAPLVVRLNTTLKLFGVVRSGGDLLGGVSWKGSFCSTTSGYFCFPLLPEKGGAFIPYKAGYRFSPDIIYDSPSNRGFLKEFKALGLKSDFELTDHLVFRNRITNLRRRNDQEIISNGVKLIRDGQRGPCAWFPGRAYLDAGTQSITALKRDFTVTAWIKPTQLSGNNSILGKGTNFVLKLHDGILTYTMQGVKDYYAVHSRVPVNQWTFISLVHSDYENHVRFYLNGLLTDQAGLILPYRESEHTLLIGSNLWEEFFVGKIGELKIWQRELNDDEIRRQYLDSLDGNTKSLSGNISGLIIVLGLVTVLFFLLKKRRVFKSMVPGHRRLLSARESTSRAPREQVLCFGGLRLINQDGTDISRKFPPKIKQMFVLVLLHSVNGQKGITTNKLSGILWPGMSPQHSKNTRGTSAQNLKSILSSCSDVRLVFRDKLWFIELDPCCYCDYTDALSRIEKLEKLQKDAPVPVDELKALFKILNAGTLFPNMGESWLDPYLSKMSDRIIELGLSFLNRIDEIRYAALVYEMADVISLHDPLNEPALYKKLAMLTLQGKLSLAHTVYDHFTKLYQELYQESYPVDFRSMTMSHE